ncbi:MAG: hypothetical protein ABSE41_16550 [Bacteroidota bacterium]|jgi:hypothetical protein
MERSCNISSTLRLVVIGAVAVTAVFLGCDKSFDPRGSLDDQMVVFSVLSTDRTAQLVRVQTSYMPQGFDPLTYTTENFLRDAIVSINTSSGSYLMRDTLLYLPDTTRYKPPTRAYVLDPFSPVYGETCEIVVQSTRHGVAYSSVVIPSQSKISIDPLQIQVLDRPENYSKDTRITFVAQLSNNAQGYVCRLYLYYDVLKGTKYVEERVEVPITSTDPSVFSLDTPIYPRLASVPQTFKIGSTYKNGYYKATVSAITSRYRSKLIFKWATFVVLQADNNLFRYYLTTHPDQDPFSIRLDQPLFSGLNGGLGMVGAYSLDSLVDLLPGNFWGNR